MFYRCEEGHPFAHNPFKALIAPRPIGWISSLSHSGVANLAPYSFFQAICDVPPVLMFSSIGEKDSLRNIREQGEFVCNLVGKHHQDAMNASSATVAPDVDEFALAGLTAVPSECVAVPRVQGAVASLECVLTEIIVPRDRKQTAIDCYMVLGEVVAVHIDDAFIHDGQFDAAQAGLLARMGYKDYSEVTECFTLSRPS